MILNVATPTLILLNYFVEVDFYKYDHIITSKTIQILKMIVAIEVKVKDLRMI